MKRDRKKQIDEAMQGVRKLYGEDSMHTGADVEDVDRIPTGSLALDYATCGGIPIGRFSRFYGGFSSCKSLTCWRIIKQAQEMGMVCAYFNIEKQYDKRFVEKIGVNVKDLFVIEGTTIEETGVKMEGLLSSIDLFVVDSCSNAVSLDELNAPVENWQMGLAARVWGKVMRRANERFDTDRNCVILVDQIRDSFGYGGGHTVPGGRFLEHISSMSLLFRRGKWMFYDKNGTLSTDATSSSTMSGAAEADGIEVMVKVEKNRVGRPFRTAKMYLDLNTMQFDLDSERAQIAKYFDVVEKSGTWFKLPNGETVQGSHALRGKIAEDDDLQASIDAAVAANF